MPIFGPPSTICAVNANSNLGSQLAATVIDRDTHNRLQIDHDRLTADNLRLQGRIEELQNTLHELHEDLAASRRARAEDIAHHTHSTRSDSSVIPINRS
ncbi:MAG TPA: hypothetical protein VMU34_12140 [Mycobacterium sp.]|nr:hypothetical protein [Mycobacterium sp.]